MATWLPKCVFRGFCWCLTESRCCVQPITLVSYQHLQMYCSNSLLYLRCWNQFLQSHASIVHDAFNWINAVLGIVSYSIINSSICSLSVMISDQNYWKVPWIKFYGSFFILCVSLDYALPFSLRYCVLLFCFFHLSSSSGALCSRY